MKATTPEQIERRRLAGQKAGRAWAAVASARRIAKWQALGIDPEVGQRIYTAGFMCAYQQLRRKAKATV